MLLTSAELYIRLTIRGVNIHSLLHTATEKTHQNEIRKSTVNKINIYIDNIT